MVKIQLETGYLDVKEGADFPLNFGVAEIRDLTKRSGTFSKSITLVGSKNNHDLLSHYYDVNIEAGTFNINTLTKCTVLQNDIPILSDAYLQLTAVNKKQISGAYEERVEYMVVVKDTQSDFFTKIDNLLLEDIDLSDLNNEFNATNILASFTNTVTDGYVYLLPYTPTNQLPINEFKPAVYSKVYWDRIHQAAGFQYEWSDLSNALFDKTIIPYNGGQLLFDYEDFLVEANRNVTLSHTPAAGLSTNFNTNLTGWTEIVDAQLLFDPTTGEYEVPFNMSAGQGLNFEITIDFDVNLNNATGGDVWLVDMDSSAAVKYFTYQPTVSIINGTTQIAIWNTLNLLSVYNVNYNRNEGVLPNGITNLGGGTYTFNLAASPLNANDILKLRGGMEVFTGTVGAFSSGNLRWKATNSTGAADVVVGQQLVINNISFRVLPNPNVIVQDATVVMNDYIPKKVKQKDFIKSICQMYNLFVETDTDNPNKLIYRHRDEYYDNGTAVDWTLKLAKNQEQVLQFLPELSAKKLLLTYKQDSDLPNTLYEDATREIYGQLEFTYDNEYIRDVDRKELIFSPTPMMPNLFGAIVPMIGGEPKTNIRILIHNGVKTCNPYNIVDYIQITGYTGLQATPIYTTFGELGVTTYPSCTHFDDVNNPTFDLNFGVCDYYFYSDLTLTNNNLYNIYWRRTVNQINKGKILTALFDLNENDIHNLRLNDKIRIDNSWWNINKVIDYNPTKNFLTKVELISIDDELALPTFRIPIIVNPINAVQGVTDIVNSFYKNNNINLSEGSVVVKGIGNVVNEGLTGFVEGDYKVITTSNQPRRNNLTQVNGITTLTNSDYFVLSLAATNIFLPPVADSIGQEMVIKNISGGNVSLRPQSGELLEGLSSLTIPTTESRRVINDSVQWWII